MVVKELVGIISRSDIDGTLAHPASNAQEEQTADDHPTQRPGPRTVTAFQRARQCLAQQEEECGKKEKYGEAHAQGIERGHTRKYALGRVEVVPHRAVQLRTPKSIQTGIGYQNDGYHQRQQRGINTVEKGQSGHSHPKSYAQHQPHEG